MLGEQSSAVSAVALELSPEAAASVKDWFDNLSH